ncbi:uncharacterized protein LOC124369546 [Homalodisca vitripennis]|uniref:uncharacterized protein LOC124369546 n=1 Tax=Homalodisca vitripennis TaxID=197043 RepID=UPI001EE9F779|nr:uncharacterized protein LOC124369546 [Homalodisca vitripennis]
MSKSKVKSMLIAFFDVKGIVHEEFVPPGQTVNGQYYREVAVEVCPEVLLRMYSLCLEEGTFPKIWKRQHLVLQRQEDPSSPSVYRPYCMLDVAGKLLEKLFRPHLTRAIQEAGNLSPCWYGFKRGKSTIGAIKDVVSTFKVAQQSNHYSMEIVLLATLDIKKAFNPARWIDIMEALEEHFRIPEYLFRMVQNYLTDQQLMPLEAFLMGFADDTSAVIVAGSTEDARLVLKW